LGIVETARQPAASIVIPAHNEERGVPRLLREMLGDARPREFEVVVVANGCTDRTAEVAAHAGAADGVRVISTPIVSKHHALQLGDAAATCFPRLHVDADVEIDTASVRALIAAVGPGGWLAAAPERRLVLDDRPLLVRAYFQFWERLPGVTKGLFGRGVLAVSQDGHERVTRMPEVLSDDLFVHRAFAGEERAVVPGAVSVVHAPRRFADLIRRRARVAAGCAQLDSSEGGGAGDGSTSRRDVLSTAGNDLGSLIRLPAFLVVTVVSRSYAWRLRCTGRSGTWLRDTGSRVG